jgi:Chlorophyll A-B binding protein
LAIELNPVVKYWDPLYLNDVGLFGLDNEKSIQYLRESEIKHGRIAMAAFVGYIVQSNFVFPWPLTTSGTPHPGTDLSPPEQFDALPLASKMQIIGFIGFLEWFWAFNKTTKVGAFPSLKESLPHPVPFDLFDPFGFSKNKSEEAKARGRLAEINNGRLAMIGIFGFLTAQTNPGSVPMLTDIVKPYYGNIWAPFEADFPL